MSFFTKKLTDITLDDIQWLIDNEITEGENLEYKSFPNSEKTENWWTGKKLSDSGRAKLLKEIVAFVNTNGGRLILGMNEVENSEGKTIPKELTPIENASKLVGSFNTIIHQSIEPVINFESPKIIDIGDNLGSVIIYEFKKSQFSPHRSSKDNKFYLRRLDKSEAMTVPEIRSNLLRSIDNEKRIIDRFEKCKNTFITDYTAKHNFFDPAPFRDKHYVMGSNITLVPIQEIYYADLFNEVNHWDIKGKWIAKFGENEEGFDTIEYQDKSPILRGVRFSNNLKNQFGGILEVFQDGSISVSNLIAHDFSSVGTGFYDVMSSLTEAFSIINKLKSHENFDYALQIVFRSVTGITFHLLNSNHHMVPARIDKEEIILPQYEVLSNSDQNELFKSINQDIFNICGEYFSYPELEIDIRL